MFDNSDNKKESLSIAKEAFDISIDALTGRIKSLIEKNRELNYEKSELIDTIKELKSNITELKLEVTKLNSSIILKDKELAENRSLIIKSKGDPSSADDREKIKSQIKELISRIDVHIEGQESGEDVN